MNLGSPRGEGGCLVGMDFLLVELLELLLLCG